MSKRFVSLLLMLLLTGIVFADPGFDDQGNPNDPTVNERANACFEGATMEYRCQNDIDWIVGWYLIRLEFGVLSRAEVPGWMFPPEAEPTDVPAPSTCAFTWNPNFYVDFSHGNFVDSGHYWNDPDCTIPGGNLARLWVYSPSGQANATNICVANLGAGYSAIPSHGPLVFECLV